MPQPEINWPTPPIHPPLGHDAVHVWAVSLIATPKIIEGLAGTLSPDEQARAARFLRPELRDRYTVGRGQLRALLGRYRQRDPASLVFAYTARGKPSLAEPDDDPLHFNLAHSGDLALIAVTRVAPVGVDVEHIRPMADAAKIAERFFSAREIAAFRTVPPDQHDAAFFDLWTRKEAWLKATGDGISESLSKFEVTFLPKEPPRVLAIGGDATKAAAWSLSALHPAGGFVGALAIPCRETPLECWRLTV